VRRVTTLCALYAAFAMPVAMLGVAWPDIRETLLRSEAELGVLAGCYGVGRLSTATVSGTLLRVASFGPATLASALVLAASCVAVAAGPSWPVLVAVVLVVGLATGALESLGTRYLAVSGSVRSAGLAAGSYGVGATVGPALVAVTGNWRLIYIVAALVTVAAGAAVASPAVRWPDGLVEREPFAVSRAPARRSHGPERAAVLLSLALFFLFVGVEATAGQWTATFLEQSRGLDRWSAGIAVSGFFAGVTVGRLLLGTIDVPVRMLPLLAGMVVPLLAGVAAGPPRLALVFVSLAGVVVAPMFPVLMATTGRRLGALHAGRVSGWQLIAGNVGATALPAATGLVVGSVSPDAVIFVLMTAGTVGTALLMLMAGDWIHVAGVAARRSVRLGG
jgi:fucose permease